ncbi:hypothetical protein [Microbacterium hydrocarbonoxydans]|nr:hypothetical protein [Microbacterium hydrocarbonoxydans]
MTDDLRTRLHVLRAHLRPDGLLLVQGANPDYYRVMEADYIKTVFGGEDGVSLEEVEANYLPL